MTSSGIRFEQLQVHPNGRLHQTDKIDCLDTGDPIQEMRRFAGHRVNRDRYTIVCTR